MTPYIALVGIPLFVAYFLKHIKINGNKDRYVIASFFIAFITVLSLRGLTIGNDTQNYYYYYQYFAGCDWDGVFLTDVEPGYAVFTKLISLLGTGFQVFLSIVSVIALLPVWIMYNKKQDNVALAISLFLCIAPFHMYFSGLRQIIAMSLAYPAYYFCRNKKPVLFVLLVIFAMLFHRSAFIIFIMYPLCRMRITKKWLWAVIPVMGVVFVFNAQIFTFLTVFINDFYTADISSTGAYTVLLLLIVLAIYSYLIPAEDLLDDDTIAMRNLLLLSVVLQCFASLHSLAMRMNYYFLPFIPVLISRIVMRTKEKNAKIAEISVVLMTLVFTVYFFYGLSRGGGLNIYPYKPFWR